ncbi:MAG: FprA family A-type flavoprotein [Cyanobacteria bacterium P01_G01_bin.39]
MSQATIRPRTKIRDVQIADVGINTQVLRSRTWDKLKSEVEYSQQKGTTSNSYLIKADQTALIDPPGQSFTHVYLEILSNHEWRKIDYIILQHVNPNRLATIQLLAGYAPQAQIICSQPTANALKAALIFPEWKSRVKVVKDHDTIDLGQGHKLQFISVTTPRWLDGLCTYDPQSQILFTDKLFGTHLCNEFIFEDHQNLNSDRRFYFDCLYASQTKQLEAILAKFTPLEPTVYAPAHGSLVKHSLSQVNDDYYSWCQEQNERQFKVVLLYASAHGNTTKMKNAIALGLIQSGIAVESINCELNSIAEITTAVQSCDGFIVGSPTLGGHQLAQIQRALEIVLANTAETKLAGLFGSYAWNGEAISLLENKLREANYDFGFEPLRVCFSPNDHNLEECIQVGKEFSQKLQKSKRVHNLRLLTHSQAS